MDTEKIKFSIRMDEELVRTADAYVQEGMALSRTEMIEDALRFYLGFLSAEKSEDYLLQSLPVRHTNALHSGKLMTAGNDIGHNQIDEVDQAHQSKYSTYHSANQQDNIFNA